MLGGKCRDRTFKPLGALNSLQVLARIARFDRFRRGRHRVLCATFVGPGRVRKERDEPVKPTLARPHVIDRPTDGDGMDPRGEFRVAAKGPKTLPDGEPDFLANIPGTVFVSQHGTYEAKHRFIVTPHERAERVFIARLRTLNEVAFGFRRKDFDVVGHR